MCGFVGVLNNDKEFQISEIRNAVKSIEHRGPDNCGFWYDTLKWKNKLLNIGFGHVRLSIIDLSEQGNQPMVAGNGRVIIHNGEIYNYLEIKKELEKIGHEFKSDTDTEVILAAYQQWGESCVERFIGMWAFAIWDGEKLFMSRDRLGQKPLYFYLNRSEWSFVFASEIKALKNIPGVPWKPDERTVYRFLAFAEMESDGNSFYDEIKEFPPGSYLSYRPGQINLKFRRYWTLPEEQIDISENNAVGMTYELLSDSIRLRLRSDVPIGLSLSGGLDSTLLLSIINELGYSDFPVFSSGYIEKGYNEIEYINIATQELSCKPYATVSDKSQFISDFEKLIYHLDQPSKLSGAYSQWRIANLASKKVKVLIDGQGPDEMAGGYLYFLPTLWREINLIEKIKCSPDLFLTILHNRHVLSQYPLSLIYERLKGKVASNRKVPIQPAWASNFADEQPIWRNDSSLSSILRESITATSLPALLRYGDRNYTAFGIEGRSPFLDHRLIEFVSALPSNMKIRGGTTKWIFHKVAENRIPKAISERRVKMGFPTPVGEWYRHKLYDDTKRRLKEYMQFPLFNRWIDTDLTFNLLEQHVSEKVDHQALLWRILSIGAWLKVSEVE